MISESSAFGLVLSYVHECPEEGTRCYNNTFAIEGKVKGCFYTNTFASV